MRLRAVTTGGRFYGLGYLGDTLYGTDRIGFMDTPGSRLVVVDPVTAVVQDIAPLPHKVDSIASPAPAP